jgi:hypothetical protein
MIRLQSDICKNKQKIILSMGGSELRTVRRTSELLPDFDLGYDGLDDRHYSIWLPFELATEFKFLYEVRLKDFGFVVSDVCEEDDLCEEGNVCEELSKSASGGDSQLAMSIQSVDRFACRVFIRGELHGSSVEMNMDVAFDLEVAGFSTRSDKLGFAAEAIAEGYAFECENRMKQAFFSYFTAIDSFLDAEREKLNRGLPSGDQIKVEERQDEKLRKVVKQNLSGGISELNAVKLWGNVSSEFKSIAKRRNLIAHNLEDLPVEQEEVDRCFSLLAVLVAMVCDHRFEEKDIRVHYGV